MNNLKKIILRILVTFSAFLILLIGLFIFVIKKNRITELNRKATEFQPTIIKVEKTTPEFERGKELFISDCNVCHKRQGIINTYRMKTRMMDEMGIEYFKKYITQQDSLWNAKDLYVSKLKEEYGNLGNSHNFKYSKSELSDLIEYIKMKK